MKREPDVAQLAPPAMLVVGVIAVLAFGLSTLGSGMRYASPVAAVAEVEVEDKTIQVKIDNFSFSPSTLTVAPGTKVTWVNRDDIPHTVVSPEKKFKSDVLDTDQQFSFTFTDKGTYDYFCSLHPKMTGKVVVQ